MLHPPAGPQLEAHGAPQVEQEEQEAGINPAGVQTARAKTPAPLQAQESQRRGGGNEQDRLAHVRHPGREDPGGVAVERE